MHGCEAIGLVLNGKAFEAALIKMACANGVVNRMPPLSMSRGNPMNECREVAIIERPQEHMPVVGHNTVGRKTHRDFFEALGEDFFEDVEVGKAAEDILLAVGTVEDVINNTSRRLSSYSWHREILRVEYTHVNFKAIKIRKRGLTPLIIKWRFCY